MIRALLSIAHAHGDAQREQQVRDLLARLAAGRFQLAVIGQFSRGKTTLMNALLGGAYLPMGALPMTSAVTTVRYGAQARALIRSHATALPVEVPVTEVARFVGRASMERIRMQVASVEVELPAELLRLGFEFVDTPGVGSAIATNTAATLNYLPQADAIVFVTGFDSALTSGEAEFLPRMRGPTGRLFVVINKHDLVSHDDALTVTEYVRRWTRANLSGEPPIFAISALQALEGATNRDGTLLAASGIGPLRDSLTRFLTAEQGRTALDNVAAAAAELVGRQQRDLMAGRLGTGPGAEHHGVVGEFETRVRELGRHLADVAERTAGTASTAVSELLKGRDSAWRAELYEMLESAEPVPGDTLEPEGDAAPDFLDALCRTGGQVTGVWLTRRAAELREALIGAVAGDIGVIFDLALSPRDLGATIAGLPVLDSHLAGWAADELPQVNIPLVGWSVPSVSARRRRRLSQTSTGSRSHSAICAYRDAAVADFADRAALALQNAAADWVQRLSEQAQRQADAEADQFRRYLSTPPGDRDDDVLTDLSARLAVFRQSLAAWIPDNTRAATSSTGQPRPAPVDGTGGACTICSRMETAQTKYLIRRQLQLATSEGDQVRHAEAGGFCRLHTWQYLHLASPTGIAAGNARLVGQLAAALREVADNSCDIGEIAASVAGLAQDMACPACAVIGKIERDQAGELAARAAAETPRLCLRHLALVLDRHPSLDAGRAITNALAEALVRASQDMRAYALKREALRRSLITKDEAHAYSDALRLLAGEALLALPAQPQ